MTQPALFDHVAIVTGAGHGRGEAIARALAAAGVRVAVNDLNPDRAARVAAAIGDDGGRAIDIAADISNKFQGVHVIETTRGEWGRLDILVNNAAVQPHGTILKLDEWEWQRCLDVNLKGTFFMSQLAGRVMADENAGRGATIINIASTAGTLAALPGAAAFGASMAGVVGFARECAREYAGYGIDVYTLLATAPGERGEPVTGAHTLLEAGLPAEIPAAVVALCAGGHDQPAGAVLAESPFPAT